VISVHDASIFGEILRKISQHSSLVRIEKTKDKLIISSLSTDELSFASVIFNKPFFKEWDGRTQSSLDIESRTLYDVSRVIGAKSNVMLSLFSRRLQFEIKDLSYKKITITGSMRESDTLIPLKKGKPSTKLRIKAKDFRSVITELSSLLDEVQLLLKKNSNGMVFLGKRTGMFMEMYLHEISSCVIQNDISIEFPIKFFQHFLPLLCHFEELLLTFTPTMPLKIEACNEKWKLVLMVSKIEKPSEKMGVTEDIASN